MTTNAARRLFLPVKIGNSSLLTPANSPKKQRPRDEIPRTLFDRISLAALQS
jgi:hypothetical protein